MCVSWASAKRLAKSATPARDATGNLKNAMARMGETQTRRRHDSTDGTLQYIWKHLDGHICLLDPRAAPSPHYLVLVCLGRWCPASSAVLGFEIGRGCWIYDHCQPLGIAISRPSISRWWCFAHPPRPRGRSGKVGTVAKGSAPHRTEGGSAGSTWRILALVGSR